MFIFERLRGKDLNQQMMSFKYKMQNKQEKTQTQANEQKHKLCISMLLHTNKRRKWVTNCNLRAVTRTDSRRFRITV